jgi:hypothetical protein
MISSSSAGEFLKSVQPIQHNRPCCSLWCLWTVWMNRVGRHCPGIDTYYISYKPAKKKYHYAKSSSLMLQVDEFMQIPCKSHEHWTETQWSCANWIKPRKRKQTQVSRRLSSFGMLLEPLVANSKEIF